MTDLFGRKARKVREAREEAAMKEYWAKRQPFFDEEVRLLNAEQARYKELLEPIEKEHTANVIRIYGETMKKLNEADKA